VWIVEFYETAQGKTRRLAEKGKYFDDSFQEGRCDGIANRAFLTSLGCAVNAAR
jgi:hypothetical protein